MNKVLEKIEIFVDRSIPYLIGVLIVIVMVDLFNKELAEAYHTPIIAGDYTIITFFVVDLIFKYNRVRDVPKFVKMYWLDILAVFPFVLVLRLFTEPILIYEEIVNALKKFFHIGIVVEEVAATATKTAGELARIAEAERLAKISETERVTKAFETIAKEESIVRTTELISKESRFARLEKFIRPLSRIPRFFKAISFYEHPKEKKTLYH